MKTQRLAKKTGPKPRSYTPEELEKFYRAELKTLEKTGEVECHRCGERWIPRSDAAGEMGLPKVCASCKNLRWFIPRESAEDAKLSRKEKNALSMYLDVLRKGREPLVAAIRKLIATEHQLINGEG